MAVWLLILGLISILGQVVLLRELNVAFYGSELIYILAFGMWLLSSAAGAAAGRRSHLPAGRSVRLLLVVFAALLPAVVVEVRALRRLFGAVPGAYLPFPSQVAAMAVALLPVGILLGLLFQWSAKLYVASGPTAPSRAGGSSSGTLAAAYALESAGGVAGGALATVLLAWGVQNLTTALLGALVSLAAACHPWHRERPRWLLPAVAVVGGILVTGAIRSANVDRRLTAWNHPRLVDTRDTPYGRVTVTETAGQVSVFENDALAFETESTDAEELAHLAALQHAAPEAVLVIGGGIEGTVRELLRHRPSRIDDVELNATMLERVIPRLPEPARTAMAAPAVRIHINDPRRFLARATAYDLILIGMPEPDSGRTNRYYTREFFEQCAGHLTRDGVLAFRLRGAENLWTPWQTRRAASIHRALRAVFADVVDLPATSHVVLAAKRTLTRDPGLLAKRLRERGITARLVIPEYLRYLYTNDRFSEMARRMARADVPTNTDRHPICYPYTLMVWLSKFYPAMAVLEVPEMDLGGIVRSPWSWILAAIAVAATWLGRRRVLGRRVLLAAVAGLVGMVLETVLILQYQTARGVLFQDLGLLLTLFMAGLALGAAAMHRRARRASGLTTAAGVAAVAGLAGLSLLVAVLLSAGAVAGLWVTSALLLGCGWLVAAVFAYASLHREPDQRELVSPLYGADLLGGCVGSLAAALFLIPALGLPGSAALMAILGLVGVLLV